MAVDEQATRCPHCTSELTATAATAGYIKSIVICFVELLRRGSALEMSDHRAVSRSSPPVVLRPSSRLPVFPSSRPWPPSPSPPRSHPSSWSWAASGCGSPTSTSCSGRSSGITKRDLLAVLRRRRAVLLPHLARSRDGDEALSRTAPTGKCFFMKRAPDAAAGLDRDLRDRARLGQRHRFPDGAGPRVAALGRQPRLHRPQPVVRALRRRRSPRLPALRSRSRCRARRSRRCVETALVVRDALEALGMQPLVKTTGSKGMHVYVPIVRGPTQKQVWTLRQGASRQTLAAQQPDAASPPSTASPSGRRAACSSTTTRTPGAARSPRCTRRGPKPHAHRLDAGHLGRGRERACDRGLPHRQRAGAHARSSATCGSRCSRRADASTWSALL